MSRLGQIYVYCVSEAATAERSSWPSRWVGPRRGHVNLMKLILSYAVPDLRCRLVPLCCG